MLKKTRMIMFAVIAVVIVAAPVSFYGMMNFHSNILVKDASATGTLKGNFTSATYSNGRLNYSIDAIVNETSYVYSGNETVGSLYLSSIVAAEFFFQPQMVMFVFRFTLDGNFSSSLHPTSILFHLNASAPGTPESIAAYRLSLILDSVGSSLFPGYESLNNISIPFHSFHGKEFSCSFSLNYPSSITAGDIFHFGMYGSNGSKGNAMGIGFAFMQITTGNLVKNLTVTYTMSLYALGLTEPLQDTITTYIVDTGVSC